MLRFAHRLMLVLIVFAIIGGPAVSGGPAVRLALPAQHTAPMTMAGMPCDMTMPTADTGHGSPMAPCKGLTPDCIKQMGCIVDVAFPARLASAEVAAPDSAAAYWSARSEMDGLARAPEPLPPRTA
jgi:hypothetical protein